MSGKGARADRPLFGTVGVGTGGGEENERREARVER
jgi:hypothetical protein